MTTTVHFTDWRSAMRVTVPEGQHGNAEIRRFEVGQGDSTLSFIGGRGRGTPPGTYTGLYRRGALWMSDTPDEQRDHMPACWAARELNAERVLVNGLGLGMVVAAFLAMESVRHVDVVEIDADVIALAAPHYEAMAAEAGKAITVHHGDAFSVRWSAGVTWDLAWHDIWRDLCTDNLPQMATLHRRYGRRVRWQGSWGRGLLEVQRQREKRMGW